MGSGADLEALIEQYRAAVMARPQPTRIEWTDENCAYAAAQWASGIGQAEVARHFGVARPTVCVAIERFVDLWGGDGVERYPDGHWTKGARVAAQGRARRALVKGALRHFVEHRAWLASRGRFRL